jgi:AcrR family transcriptional regulator
MAYNVCANAMGGQDVITYGRQGMSQNGPGRAKQRQLPQRVDGPADGRELNRDEVVAAVCRLIDRDGIDKFTMRALAAELDFSTMAAYRHVKSKEDAIIAAADSVLARVVLPASDGRPWQERFDALGMAVWAQIEQARWVPAFLISKRVSTPNLDRILNELDAILRDAGLSAEEARKAMAVSWSFSIGLLMWIDKPRPYLRFGIEVILAGIEQRQASRRAQRS